MGDVYPNVKAAAVQAASVFLDHGASTEGLRPDPGGGPKRRSRDRLPGKLVPAHPVWFHFHAATGSIATRLSVELFKNAVEIPGPEIEALQAAARDANASDGGGHKLEAPPASYLERARRRTS